MRRTTAVNTIGRIGLPIFGITMVVIQCYLFFGPAPASPAAAALSALVSYVVFAAVAQWLDRQRKYASVKP